MKLSHIICLIIAGLGGLGGLGAASDDFLSSFELSDVQLHTNSFQHQAASSNLDYLLQLDPDRMLWVFRKNANLTTPGEPFYGTWEDPWCELRGHFVGHYLTALSLATMSSNFNATLVARLELYVTELKAVQDALKEDGYLSAFPSEHIDRVEALKGVWAPYYVLHKIMMGLIDAYTLGRIPLALEIVKGMAGYFFKRSKALVASKGEEYWQATLRTEYGGMNEAMYRLYGITKDPNDLEFARMWDKKEFVIPLTKHEDRLAGLHANTHLAQVVGLAERVEVMDKEAKEGKEAKDAVAYFFSLVGTGPHAYATGGSNDKEFWFPPGILGEAVSDKNDSLETQEICTQYNILKIARSLFRWTKDVRIADFYERALVNGILGVSRLNNDQVNADEAGHHHHHHHHHSHSHSNKSDAASISVEGLLLPSGFSDQHRFRSAEIRKPPANTSFTNTSSLNAHQISMGGPIVSPHRRPFVTRFQDYWGFNIDKIKGHETADNSPGTPGSFLYLLPMGSGQSKRDNFHHWGYPFHSFWCCYGTAIESFAKLADSIFFKETLVKGSLAPPKLYINQLVGSLLTWRDLNVTVNMTVDAFATDSSTKASIKVAMLSGKNDTVFSMLLRIPQWADTRTTAVKVNGDAWKRCPSYPSPGSYCTLTRTWKDGDTVEVSIGLGFWWKGLPDVREQYKGLKALMMGPHVMAALTHDTRWLELPKSFTSTPMEGKDKGTGHLSTLASTAASPSSMLEAGSEESSAKAREDLSRRIQSLISDPQQDLEESSDQLVSLQASWNSSLFLRHDRYHGHLSVIEDGGDAIDATFKIVRRCPLLSSFPGEDTVMLESMNLPGLFLGFIGTDKHLTLTQPSPDSKQPCSDHMFIIRKSKVEAGLVSLESYVHPGSSISASAIDSSEQSCDDTDAACSTMMHNGECISRPEYMRVHCRKSCDSCASTTTSLQLVSRVGASLDLNAHSRFRMVKPLTSRYPPGSKIIKGVNRQFLVTPLGRLVDERYSVYFQIRD